jgi:hypothetical protein
MKELTLASFSSSLANDIHAAKVFKCSSSNLKRFSIRPEDDFDGEIVAPGVLIVDLSHNHLITPSSLFETFPARWWMNLADNPRLEISFRGRCPTAFGKLDLSKISNAETIVDQLTSIHILRLHLDVADEEEVSRRLPYVWTLNNHYIPLWKSRSYNESNVEEESLTALSLVSDDGTSVHPPASQPNSDISHHATSSASDVIRRQQLGDWIPHAMNKKETLFFECLRSIPIQGSQADEYRLDILLEDYLEEAYIWNEYGMKHQRLSLEAMLYPNIQMLLLLPHHLLLDFSVLLTASVLFKIPDELLKNVIIILLGRFVSAEDAKSYVQFPSFAKTALVSFIRRFVRAQLELQQKKIGMIDVKPMFINNLDPHPSSMFGNKPQAFFHLRAFKLFLETCKSADGKRYQSNTIPPFSDLEHELMKLLPDIPLASMLSGHSSSSSYDDWIGLASRHAVLLLTKSPLCPALIKPQTNQPHQTMYDDLLPLLSAASMTYKDLEIKAKGSSEYCSMRYGQGLPEAFPSQLPWNQQAVQSVVYSRPSSALSDQHVGINGAELGKEAPSSSCPNLLTAVVEGFADESSWTSNFVLTSRAKVQTAASVSWSRIDEPPAILVTSFDPSYETLRSSMTDNQSSVSLVLKNDRTSDRPSSSASNTGKLNAGRTTERQRYPIYRQDQYLPSASMSQEIALLKESLLVDMGSKRNARILDVTNQYLQQLTAKRSSDADKSMEGKESKVAFKWSSFTTQRKNGIAQNSHLRENTFITNTILSADRSDDNMLSEEVKSNDDGCTGPASIGDSSATAQSEFDDNILDSCQNSIQDIKTSSAHKMAKPQRLQAYTVEGGSRSITGFPIEAIWYTRTDKFAFAVAPMQSSRSQLTNQTAALSLSRSYISAASTSSSIPQISLSSDIPPAVKRSKDFLKKQSSNQRRKELVELMRQTTGNSRRPMSDHQNETSSLVLPPIQRFTDDI